VDHAHAREFLSVPENAVPNQSIDFVDQAPQDIVREAQGIHALGYVANDGKAVADDFLPERLASFQILSDWFVAATCFEVLLTAGLGRNLGDLVWRWLLGDFL
jgi:hypothetical protein